MALEWFDGFDQYGSQLVRVLDGVYAEVDSLTSSSLSTANPRTGTRHLRIAAGNNNAGVRRVLTAPRAAFGLGYAFSINSLPTDATSFALIQARNSLNNPIFTLTVGPTGDLTIRNGSRSGPAIAEYVNPAVFANAYQHFEIRFSSSGFEVRMNEVALINSDQVPVSITGGNVVTSVKIGNGGAPLTGASAITWDIDDVFCWNTVGAFNNNFVGDCKVYTRFPDADETPEQWTRSTGADSFALLDNVPPDDANVYLTADGLSVPTRSVFTVPDLPVEIVDIRGILLSTRTFKTDAGGAKVRSGIISAAAEELSVEHALSMAPIWYNDVFDTDPNTSTDWTLTAASQVKVLVERTE